MKKKTRKGSFRIPFVLGISYVAYANTRTNIGIYEVERGYVFTNMYIYSYYLDNNELRAQRNVW